MAQTGAITKEKLARLAKYGDPIPDERLINSPFWIVFQRRLSKLSLVLDAKTVANLKRLTFEVQDPDEEVVENYRFPQADLSERKSWQMYQIVGGLMAGSDAFVNSRFSTQSLIETNIVSRELENKFYRRFAIELFSWLELAKEENQDSLVSAVPTIASFICDFAVKSQESEDDLVEAGEALRRIGLSFEEIQTIIAETKSKRRRLEAEELYKSIVNNPQSGHPFREDNRLNRLHGILQELGLKLQDIGGTTANLIVAYHVYHENKFKVAKNKIWQLFTESFLKE